MVGVTDDEIKKMFLFAAQVRKLPSGDPRKGQAEEALERMTERYVAENMVAPSGEPAEKAPPWKDALQYVAAMFSQLDAVDPEGAAQRKAYWKEISEGVIGWNKKPAEPEAKAPKNKE